MYKILLYFGSRQINPLWLTLIIISLLLLALAQSYASAKRMRFGPALVLSLGFLVVGNTITYFIFKALFEQQLLLAQNIDSLTQYTFEHISIYSYGFMLMVSFVIGTIWLITQGKREKPKVEADTVLDLMVFIIIGSIIGARLIYVLTQWGDYQEHKENILRITEGGLSIHGGIFGALVFGWAYCRIKELDFWKMVDFVMPGLALGIFFGRIGCFLNGCCYGIACGEGWPVGFVYPNAATWQERGYSPDLASLYDAGHAAIGQYARHPAPLYESFGALLVFWYLINFRRNKAFKGHVFLMFVFLYSVLRFFVENFRFGSPDDPITPAKGSSIVLWQFITVAQLASIILGIVALFLMQDLKRRAMLTKMLKDKKDEVEVKEEPEEPESEEDELAEEEEGEEIVMEGGPDPESEDAGDEIEEDSEPENI